MAARRPIGPAPTITAVFGFQAYHADDWQLLARQLVLEAGWPLLAGGLAALLLVRRLGHLAAGALLVVALWVWSVGYTSGQLEYSMRVLSPALALLSIAAGVGLAGWGRSAACRCLAGGVLGLSLLYAAVAAAVFPVPLRLLAWDQLRATLSSTFRYAYAEQDLAPVLPQALPPGTRILTENAYAHRALAVAGADYDVVPIWSPEVAFLFDPGLDPTEQRRQLLARHITALFYYPNGPNTMFCLANSTFYRLDRPNWRVLGNFKNVFVICRLPPALLLP